MRKKEYVKGQPIRNMWRGLNNWLNGAENLATDVFDKYTGTDAVEKTNEANMAIHQMDNQFNAEQAEITRNWNSIGEQMARAQAAGVNPISIAMAQGGMNFGGDSSAQASASPAPSMLPETAQTAALTEAAASFIQANTSAFETAMLTGSKKALLQQQTQEVAASINNLNVDTATQASLLPFVSAQAKANIYNTHAQTRLTRQQADNLKQEFEQSQQRFESMFPIEVETALAERDISYLQIDKVLAEIDNLEVTSEMLESQSYLNYRQANVADAQAENIQSDTQGQNIENQLEEEKLKYKSWLAQTYAETAAEELNGLKIRNGLSSEDLAHYEKRFNMEKKLNRSERVKNYGMAAGAIATGVGQVVKSIPKGIPKIGF